MYVKLSMNQDEFEPNTASVYYGSIVSWNVLDIPSLSKTSENFWNLVRTVAWNLDYGSAISWKWTGSAIIRDCFSPVIGLDRSIPQPSIKLPVQAVLRNLQPHLSDKQNLFSSKFINSSSQSVVMSMLRRQPLAWLRGKSIVDQIDRKYGNWSTVALTSLEPRLPDHSQPKLMCGI